MCDYFLSVTLCLSEGSNASWKPHKVSHPAVSEAAGEGVSVHHSGRNARLAGRELAVPQPGPWPRGNASGAGQQRPQQSHGLTDPQLQLRERGNDKTLSFSSIYLYLIFQNCIYMNSWFWIIYMEGSTLFCVLVNSINSWVILLTACNYYNING